MTSCSDWGTRELSHYFKTTPMDRFKTIRQLVSISKKTKSHSSLSSKHRIFNCKQTLIFCLLSVVICRRKIFLAQESKLFRQRWCLFGDHDYWETKTFSMCMNDLLPRKADDRHYLLPNFTIMEWNYFWSCTIKAKLVRGNNFCSNHRHVYS